MKYTCIGLSVVLVSLLAAGCGGGGSPSGPPEITFTSQPNPPVTGDNTFEVMLMQGGQPVTDADVSVTFFMPAMPSMKMPEMKMTTPLKHEGGGRYTGSGNVMMAGSWDVTVVAMRGGQQLASRTFDVASQ